LTEGGAKWGLGASPQVCLELVMQWRIQELTEGAQEGVWGVCPGLQGAETPGLGGKAPQKLKHKVKVSNSNLSHRYNTCTYSRVTDMIMT